MTPTIFWLIVVAVMLICEIFSMGLTTIWFSIGAVVSAITSVFGAPLWLQIMLFCVVSVVVMLLVRPFAMKVIDKNRTKTNVDALVGQQVTVLETIDNQKEIGRVMLNQVEWMARSTENVVIEAGERVKIDSVSGVKLMVSKGE